jgi:hypothetical protein
MLDAQLCYGSGRVMSEMRYGRLAHSHHLQAASAKFPCVDFCAQDDTSYCGSRDRIRYLRIVI